MRTRQAKITDAKAIWEISSEQFGDNSQTLVQIENIFKNINEKVFIVLDKKDIVCFLELLISGEDLEIINIATSENHKRKGYATKLIEKYVNKKCYLEVNKQNKEAINLYIKNGFTIISDRKNYYGKNNDAIIMERKC